MKNEQLVHGYTIPVSVVIPCFCSGDVIQRAVDSVLAQTLQPLEVIVVDDCSSDNTLDKLYELVRRYDDGWLKIIALPENKGPGTARNTGWAAASGDYIAFLDADDAWHPNKLEIQYSWMKAHPEVVLSGHAFVLRSESEAEDSVVPSRGSIHTAFFPISKFRLLAKNYFPTPTVMVRRDVSERFLEGKKYSEEYLLACEICSKDYLCAASAFPLTYIYKDAYGAGGLSGDLWEMEKGELEVYYLLFKRGRVSSIEFMGFSAFSFLKYIRRFMIVGFRRFFSRRYG